LSIFWEEIFSAPNVQTGSGAHPGPCFVVTRSLLWG